MSLGIAIFASVVLILLVYNQQFRKIFFWIAGVGAVLTGLVLGMYLYRIHKEKVAVAETAKQKIRVQACLDRFSKPEENYYIDTSGTRMDVFDVLAEGEKN